MASSLHQSRGEDISAATSLLSIAPRITPMPWSKSSPHHLRPKSHLSAPGKLSPYLSSLFSITDPYPPRPQSHPAPFQSNRDHPSHTHHGVHYSKQPGHQPPIPSRRKEETNHPTQIKYTRYLDNTRLSDISNGAIPRSEYPRHRFPISPRRKEETCYTSEVGVTQDLDGSRVFDGRIT